MLTRKAILNALAAFIDQAARICVGFIVTPLLVRYLGVVDFGIWQIIQKMSLQLAVFDGRAAETLKWMVANEQSDEDHDKKRRSVGAAIVISLMFLPLLVIVNASWLWFAPDYIGVDASRAGLVRYGVLIMSFNIVLIMIFSILEAILRGVNKGYKRIGVLASILILGGVLNVFVVYLGYGIVGVASVQIAVSLLTLLTYLHVVRRHVSWAGVSKPGADDVSRMFGKAKWFTIWAFINIGIYAGDVILLGYFASSEVVSGYVLTFYAANIITVAILTAVSSVLPGLGGLVGKGELQRAANLRRESLLISWILSTIICSVLLVLNGSFIGLWVGEDAYLGDTASGLIVLSAFQLVFIRHDAFMLNMMLDIKSKVFYGSISLGLTVLLAFILVPDYGVVGLSVALLLGRLLLSVVYPYLIRRFLSDTGGQTLGAKKYAVTLLLFLLCYYGGTALAIGTWWQLLAWATVIVILVTAVLLLGLNKYDRIMLGHRLTMVQRSVSGG